MPCEMSFDYAFGAWRRAGSNEIAGDEISRRVFLGGLLSAVGGMALPYDLYASSGAPLLRLGVISDVHIGGRAKAPILAENALRWLDARGVDAVLCPGDIAHLGRISQMMDFSKIWHKVFPGNKAKDGRRVQFMISTGNHDVWEYPRQTEDWKRQNLLTYKDNPIKIWDEQFGLKWDLVWRQEVKGIAFIGSQWPTLGADPEGFMRLHGHEFDPGMPFFYCQHAHPQKTCHGRYGECSSDRGLAARLFSKHPNAVVFSGDSHCSLVDERSVWQGTFTSIGSGCIHEGGLGLTYENCAPKWHPLFKQRMMKPLNDAEAWGGDCEGGCFLYVEVYADHLVLHRRSSVYDLPMGPAWIVPLPARQDGPFDFTLRAAKRHAPEFSDNARVMVQVCPNGHDLEGIGHRNEPCVYVAFPAARSIEGCRVFDYVVTARSHGKIYDSKLYFAAGAALPEAKAVRMTECLFALKGMPSGKDVTFEIVPRECFGMCGHPLFSDPITMPA